MAYLNYLEIVILPYIYDNKDKEIRIKVRGDGYPDYELREVISDNHFESFFEIIFDRAKKLIKDEINKNKND